MISPPNPKSPNAPGVEVMAGPGSPEANLGLTPEDRRPPAKRWDCVCNPYWHLYLYLYVHLFLRRTWSSVCLNMIIVMFVGLVVTTQMSHLQRADIDPSMWYTCTMCGCTGSKSPIEMIFVSIIGSLCWFGLVGGGCPPIYAAVFSSEHCCGAWAGLVLFYHFFCKM